MTQARRTVCWLVIVAAVGAAAAGAQPRLERRDGARVVLTRLPPVLTEEEVERQLTTGLTTTFAFRLDVPGEPRGGDSGGARVEIRYGLWDEVFLARTVDAEGEHPELALGSMEELVQWWGELELVVLASHPAPGERTARVRLEVVPFSRSEQLDTQRWLSDSASRSEGPGSRTEGGESLGRVFRVLIATSIQRRPLTEYRWSLTIPARENIP